MRINVYYSLGSFGSVAGHLVSFKSFKLIVRPIYVNHHLLVYLTCCVVRLIIFLARKHYITYESNGSEVYKYQFYIHGFIENYFSLVSASILLFSPSPRRRKPLFRSNVYVVAKKLPMPTVITSTPIAKHCNSSL